MKQEPQPSVGMKNDALDNKPRWELLPMEPIEEVVKILTYGAKKYAPYNWQHVEPFNERYYAATMRHLVAWRRGELTDPESGNPHLAHALCNLVFLLWKEQHT